MTYETLANHGFSSPRDILSAATKQYAWIINPTTSLDPARFLFQWLAVSLTEIPLLVYQSPTESATLEDLFQVGYNCDVVFAERAFDWKLLAFY